MSTVTFPLFRAFFADILKVSEVVFTLGEAVQVEETEGGEVLMANLGTRLWEGEFRLGGMTPAEWAQVEPMLDLLRQAGRTFHCYDTRRPNPAFDPQGTLVAGATVVTGGLPTDAREIALTGLPANYQLRRGDYLAFGYATNPVRQALHRVVEPVTASAGGITGPFEIIPARRPGLTAGTTVELRRPWCNAVIVPGSVDKGSFRRGLAEGAGFRFRQTLRA